MSGMKQLNESFFRTICLAFSAVVLICYLLMTIDSAAEQDRRGKLAREVQELSEENDRLSAQVQKSFSPGEIERFARERLGMQPAGPGQIVYLKISD